MRPKASRLRWWLVPVTLALGSLVLDASIVATDYLMRERIASAAPRVGAALRPAASFASIADEDARSRALFVEAGTAVTVLARSQAAPRETASEARSLAEICEQLEAPLRSGATAARELREYVAHDPYAAWAGSPGSDRQLSPNGQARLRELLEAWIDTGAVCPSP